MTVNWLIFKNETCVATSPVQLNTSLVCIFFDHPLMVGSARKAVVPGVCRNTCFRQYAGDDSAYNPVK